MDSRYRSVAGVLAVALATFAALAIVAASVAVGMTFGAAAGWVVVACVMLVLAVACAVLLRSAVKLGSRGGRDDG